MKKFLLQMLALFLFSCKNNQDKGHEVPDALKVKNKIVVVDTLAQKQKPLKIDTLHFEKLKTAKIFDKVIAFALKRIYTKDSVEGTLCRLDFYRDDKLVQSFPMVSDTSEQGEWSLSEDVFPEPKGKILDDRFFSISYGYPACGYIQTNFLFFTENNKLQLVRKYNSIGDGPYSEQVEFEPILAANKIVALASKKVTIDSDESKAYNEENEDLVISFSDSVVYRYQDKKWSVKYKTPKGKIFRTEYKTSNELYPQE